MKSLLNLLAALVLLGGCSLRPEAKGPVTYYYLQPTIETQCSQPQSSKLLTLRLADSVASLSGKNIIYKKSNLETGGYLYSKWNQAPDRAIMTTLYTALKNHKSYTEIFYVNTPLQSDLTLEIKVMQFEQRFEDEENSYALVRVDALMYETKSLKLLSSRSFMSKIKAESNDAQGGVKALNDAVGKVLSALVCWSAEQGEIK